MSHYGNIIRVRYLCKRTDFTIISQLGRIKNVIGSDGSSSDSENLKKSKKFKKEFEISKIEEIKESLGTGNIEEEGHEAAFL